ncbi:PPE family protein [Mycobacterium sp. 050134]|uniref:PPE family protein n=1 Tax=Mycobacterium sp. 050134 TaxID=3096111 RepID=UPI003FA5F7BE
MPPELNTARLMAGAGPAPMLQAAAGWEALAVDLDNQATELAAKLAALKGVWSGASSERAIASATPTVAWLEMSAQQARQRAQQATAQAASYLKALATTPSLPEIVGNHITHAVLTATNFLGINLVPIGFNETDYFVRMWNQAGTAMDLYQAETVANTMFEEIPPMEPILQPEAAEAVRASILSELPSELAPSAARALGAAAAELDSVTPDLAGSLEEGLGQVLSGLNQVGQLSGPMQQLMQPVQQLTSLASQTNQAGGGMPEAPAGSVEPGETGQVGLLGASPLSNHPLAGGSGPSVGMGLMHAESLPGAGGSAARTTLISDLIDKAPQVAPASGAAGASAAAGGSAPMSMMGAGAQAGSGGRAGLAIPALLEQQSSDDGYGSTFESEDHDDW